MILKIMCVVYFEILQGYNGLACRARYKVVKIYCSSIRMKNTDVYKINTDTSAARGSDSGISIPACHLHRNPGDRRWNKVRKPRLELYILLQ